jgi:hydroxyethylthiazole kinase-like uncharacterized protein yjeF
MNALYRTAELRALETRAVAGLPAGSLMQRAGEAAAAAIADAWAHRQGLPGTAAAPGAGGPPAARILILCGPGNNGGDGFACAGALQALGHRCVCWSPLPTASADARAARQSWEALAGTTVVGAPAAGPFDIAIDALLGIGATRPLDGALLAALRWTQARALPLAALDLPSGIDADTGQWLGGVAGAPAFLTVSFLADKPGLHMRDGLGARGRLRIADLGISPGPYDAKPGGRINGPALFAALLVRRPVDCNKGGNGTVAVAGGAAGMVGAALLAGRAALRLGAGKVFVDCLGAAELAVDLQQPELMLQPGRHAGPGEVLVAGCGMGSGPGAHAALESWIAHDGPAVFDADALNAIARTQDLQSALRARARPTVLTPHPGEAGRLLQSDAAAVQGDRLGAACELARTLGAIVVLKGAGTVIAEPDGSYVINPTGSPALATAGTGDVLAGMTGALLAQSADPLAAVHAAVWLHGRAAELHGSDVGLTASEVAALAARAWEMARADS